MFVDRGRAVSDDQRTDGRADEYAGESAHQQVRTQEMRARNRRTALVLATIALAFFVGIIVKYTLLRH